MNKETIATLVRTLLKIGSGYLVAKGIIDDTAATEITGAVVALVAVLWGLYDAKQAKAAKEVEKAYQAGTAGSFGKQSQTNTKL